jgi:hypothetical protein
MPGFWEQRGASLYGAGQPDVNLLNAEALNNGHVRLKGVAISTSGAEMSLEIRIDGGEWQRIELPIREENHASEWQFIWQPAYAGDFLVELRINMGEPQRKTILRVPMEQAS